MILKLKFVNFSNLLFSVIVILNIVQYMWIIPSTYSFLIKIFTVTIMAFEIIKYRLNFSSVFIVYMFMFVSIFLLNILIFDSFSDNFLYLLLFVITYMYIYLTSHKHKLKNVDLKLFELMYDFVLLTSLLSIFFHESVLGGRFRGFFSNPNTLGLLLAIFYPFVLFSKSSIYSKIFLGVFGLVFIFLTGSRNSLFAFILVNILFILYKLKPYFANKSFKIRPMIIFFIFFIFTVAYIFFIFIPIGKGVLQRFDNSLSSTNYLMNSRIVGFKISFEKFINNPLFGIGYNAKSIETSPTASASTYLEFLKSLGIIGTIVILFPVFIIFYRLKKLSFMNFTVVLDVLSLAIAESYMYTPLGIGAFFAWYIIISIAFG